VSNNHKLWKCRVWYFFKRSHLANRPSFVLYRQSVWFCLELWLEKLKSYTTVKYSDRPRTVRPRRPGPIMSLTERPLCCNRNAWGSVSTRYGEKAKTADGTGLMLHSNSRNINSTEIREVPWAAYGMGLMSYSNSWNIYSTEIREVPWGAYGTGLMLYSDTWNIIVPKYFITTPLYFTISYLQTEQDTENQKSVLGCLTFRYESGRLIVPCTQWAIKLQAALLFNGQKAI